MSKLLSICLAAVLLLSAPFTFAQDAKSKKARKAKAPRTTAGQQDQAAPQWIWLQDNGALAEKASFLHTFNLDKFVTARLFGSCDNEMTIFIDGKRVASSKDWQTPLFADVTSFFFSGGPQGGDGKHILAVSAKNDGKTSAGLLLKLEFESSNGDITTVVTGEDWLATTKPTRGWREDGYQPSKAWQPAQVVGQLGGAPWTAINATTLTAAANFQQPTATDPAQLKVAPGFAVELLYNVPEATQGSWVSMCVDPQGRLIVSDQYGKLFRVRLPAIGAKGEEPVIEPIHLELGEAQGLLWAFDCLYVVVNRGEKYASGLYRVRDTNGDDMLDHMELLRELDGASEHGPHSVLLSPDGKSLFVVCGNKTVMTQVDSSRVPMNWDEDVLLPRPYGRGFMKGTPPPAGCIYRTDPGGKSWELIASGFRNEYDAAFNSTGELFAYDADMEWDVNTPWYRPTRVCHVVSGAEFGWRNGGAKWPSYYPDSVPPAVEVGPGSPTGVTFGYGAKFPAKYQNTLFICDWSYGKMYATTLDPQGASYRGALEEFVTGSPLPLTDLVINPHDGAMYFAIGGRRTTSGLYRVTYVGDESTAPAVATDDSGAEARALRHSLEALHGHVDPQAVDKCWPYLSHPDRFIRYAARVAIEHQPVAQWQDRALAERDPQASLLALLALARMQQRPAELKSGPELDNPAPDYSQPDPRSLSPAQSDVKAKILAALDRYNYNELSPDLRIHLFRVYTVLFTRLGRPDEATRQQLIAKFAPVVPADRWSLNAELAQMLVYLQAPHAAEKLIALLADAPSQEEQIDYVKSLRHLTVGWTPELREELFRWFGRAAGYRGGASFELFVNEMKADVVAKLTDAEKTALGDLLNTPPSAQPLPPGPPREFVKEWNMDELLPLVQSRLHDRNFAKGRSMFGAAQCFSCHRFDNQGGAVGPDLTILAGRFNPHDVLQSILEPSKVISDQYEAVNIVTTDGRIITGRVVNLHGTGMVINTNMLDPDGNVSLDRKQIEEILPSKTSMMPQGLLNTLNQDEILDLMAYLLSRGDPDSPMFTKSNKQAAN